MHLEIAVIAVATFLWGAGLRGFGRRAPVTGPALFAAAGLAIGPAGAGLIGFGPDAQGLLLLSQYALAIVLFSDAARIDPSCLGGPAQAPLRLVGVALPLGVPVGAGLAAATFPELGWTAAVLLALLVAPTDAALGLPVVENRAVPKPLREGLIFESGLNDGLVAPAILVTLGLLAGDGGSAAGAARLLGVELGFGALVGLGVGTLGAGLIRLSGPDVDDEPERRALAVAGLAAAAFALTHAVGGAGFIGAFVAGLAFGLGCGARRHALASAGAVGLALSLAAWLVFGTALFGPLSHALTWRSVGFAALALTAGRIIPVAIAFAGSGTSLRERLFVGWFGPRGLASVVFILIAASRSFEGRDTVLAAASCTVVASVILHGVTAPFAARLVAHRE